MQGQASALKSGQYDEKESHASFQEALKEWRNAPKDAGQEPEPKKKQVTFKDDSPEKKEAPAAAAS